LNNSNEVCVKLILCNCIFI